MIAVPTGGPAGQVMTDVNAGKTAAGVGVCAHESVALTAAACGTQLKPIAGAFAPSAAGPTIVRLAPAVTANADAPVAGIVHAKPKLPPAEPAVATVTATVPVPATRVAVPAILAVGATGGAPAVIEPF